MKKFIFSVIGIVGLSFVMSGAVFAQGMTDKTTIPDDHTAREEAEGKIVWEKLQAKEISCADLSDENFGTLGEYFMGTMTGDSHAAMNAMMIQMHGEEWEEQIHIIMGKRLSGCDTSAAFPGGSSGWPSMMTGMWSFPSELNQTSNSMMNFGFMPFGWFGWIFMVLWWVLIIVGIVALIKWLAGQSHGSHNHEKSSLDILQERYAKGEINKTEFEEKKKDLIG